MKPKPIKKLAPERPLYENAARIVRARLSELRSFAPRAVDGADPTAQHDMRIAAKRLRYVLEVTDFCLDAAAPVARRRARKVQDILGEIHDCDVMLPRVERHARELREMDADRIRERAGSALDLDPRLAARAGHRTAFRGLEVLDVYLVARRKLLVDRFVELWREPGGEQIWDRLDEAAAAQLERARERRRAAKRARRAREELELARQAEDESAARALRATERLSSAGRDDGGRGSPSEPGL